MVAPEFPVVAKAASKAVVVVPMFDPRVNGKALSTLIMSIPG